MTAVISLMTIAFVIWLLIRSAKKNSHPDQKIEKNTIGTKQSTDTYRESTDDLTGEGSVLIRKHSGKKDDYMSDLLTEMDVDSRPKRKAKKLIKSPVIGSIAFDYVDTKQELSRRVVNTKEVDARHISGYCQTARGFRTFLIDGIASDVTDTETGEVMPIDRWIKQAKKAAAKKAGG